MKLVGAMLFLSLAACASDETSSQESLTRTPYSCSNVEVHVIGTDIRSYDGPTGGGDGTTVILSRPGHHVLVLSSRLANTWNVEVKGDAKLDGIYAVGHEPQRVISNVKTKISTESGMTGGADAYGYEYPSKNTSALLKLTSIRVARHATSFHGCKAASYFEIGENMATTSDCADQTQSYQQYDAVLDCDGDNTCGTDGDGDGDTGDGSGDGVVLY